MTVKSVHRDYWPLYERSSDYLFNMSALTRKEARRQWRESIKHAWNNCCAYCGMPPIDDSSLTIDHVRPKSKGGSDCTSNVTPACLSCNHSKGSMDWIEWYKDQPFYTVQGEWRIRQWLSSGRGDFAEWDEDDAKKVEDISRRSFGDWPHGMAI